MNLTTLNRTCWKQKNKFILYLKISYITCHDMFSRTAVYEASKQMTAQIYIVSYNEFRSMRGWFLTAAWNGM